MDAELQPPAAYRSDPVWQRIAAHRIGPAEAVQGFVERLAKDNGWSAEQARRVVEEYRRFCFLAVAAPHVVTPSEAVDQAWHLHLAYSRDYWQVFCPDVLGRDLHHGPTSGGAAERDKHYEQYARTLKSYEEVFGPAPEDIWPAAYKRFHLDPQARRVDPREFLIVSRRRARIVTILGVCVVSVLLVVWWLGQR